jgi:hypothetical protein
MAKIELTPSQIAFAQSDSDIYEAPTDQELAEVEEEGYEEEQPSDLDSSDLEDVNAEADGNEWIDDEVKKFAAGYLLDAAAISKEFKNKEELERFGRLTDQRIKEQARFRQFEQAAPRSQEQEVEDQPDSTDSQQESQDYELFDPQKLVDDNYDETTVSLGKALRATQEQLQELKNKGPEQAALKQEAEFAQSFHKNLDQLDRSLFGSVFDENGGLGVISNPHDLNRRAVWEAASQIQSSIPSNGAEIPVEMLIKRAVNMVFGDVLSRENESGGSQRAKAQSRKRRPTSSSRGMNRTSFVDPNEQDAQDARSIAQAPDVKKFFEKAQRQNGVV